jgi:hypothetical protein
MVNLREQEDGDDLLALDQRLSGDLAALSDFARELSQVGSRRRDEVGLRDQPHGMQHQMIVGTGGIPERINADQESVEQGLAKLVLTLIELLRRLLEKQAIRRIEADSLSEEEIERMGETFLRLEAKMKELKATFGLEDEDLNLNLGPLGDLLPE